MSCHYRIIGISYPGLALPKCRNNIETLDTNWNKFGIELRCRLNYAWFRIEGKEYLEAMAAMLGTSLTDPFNSSYLAKIVQEENACWIEELNRKQTTRKLMAAV